VSDGIVASKWTTRLNLTLLTNNVTSRAVAAVMKSPILGCATSLRDPPSIVVSSVSFYLALVHSGGLVTKRAVCNPLGWVQVMTFRFRLLDVVMGPIMCVYLDRKQDIAVSWLPLAAKVRKPDS